MTMILLLATALGASLPTAAERTPHQQRTTVTETYRVRYAGRWDDYCLRVFADPAPADPTPRTPADPCRSRADWAKDGIAISDPARDGDAALLR